MKEEFCLGAGSYPFPCYAQYILLKITGLSVRCFVFQTNKQLAYCQYL